ncbi:MAG TPA: MFS transporter [Anaerolineaceae bacterium]|nr:MFS transporter [Anaerolineaceae bacterium]
MPETSYSIQQHDLWIVRLYYFIWLGGGGSISPFLNLFLSRQNLNGIQIGWIVAIGSLIGLFAAPLWTRLNSESRYPMRLLQCSLLLTGGATLIFSWQTLFVWLAAYYALRTLFSAGQSPLSDALALRVTSATDTGYGSVRVWGSFGWAVIVLSTGWLNQQYGIRFGFIEFTFLMIIAALLLTQVRTSAAPLQVPSVEGRPGFRQVSTIILHNPVLWGLGLMLIITGVANLGIAQFENIYLAQLGARDILIGVASMASSVVEIPGMFWADRLVRRHSPAPILLISLVLYTLLRLLLFLFPSVFLIIASRAATGIAFSFYTVALVQYISRQTAANQTATALAIFTVTLPSIINITCTPLIGHVFDLVGAHWLYLIALIGYALGAVVLWAFQPRQEPGSRMVQA